MLFGAYTRIDALTAKEYYDDKMWSKMFILIIMYTLRVGIKTYWEDWPALYKLQLVQTNELALCPRTCKFLVRALLASMYASPVWDQQHRDVLTNWKPSSIDDRAVLTLCHNYVHCDCQQLALQVR